MNTCGSSYIYLNWNRCTQVYETQIHAYFGLLTTNAGIDIVLVCLDFSQRELVFAIFRTVLAVVRFGRAEATIKHGRRRPTRSRQGWRPEETALLDVQIFECLCKCSLVTLG